jgi:hypothetical protein
MGQLPVAPSEKNIIMVKIGHDAENVSITNAILGPRIFLCLLHCACAGVRTKTKLVIRKLLPTGPTQVWEDTANSIKYCCRCR